MSTIQKQMVWGIMISLMAFFLIIAAFLNTFPMIELRELWNRRLLDIPFIVIIPTVSILMGMVAGLIAGFNFRKQLQSVDNYLHEVEEGRSFEIKDAGSTSSIEMNSIIKRVGKIQKIIIEQAKLSQKLANEKAEDQENRIQEIISQERNRLARELHDSVSQQLFAASMMMSAINETKQATDEREAKQLKMVEEMIHQSQLEMRALLLHLRPVALKGKTLQEGMEELLFELSQKVTMAIQWKVEEFPLDKGIEDHLFRILQESVSNTLRHSKASQLEVLLILRDELIIMRIVDDGIGFDVEENKAGSYGLQNMYDRAVEIGGTIKIVSVKNKGTRLEVKVPMMKKGEVND